MTRQIPALDGLRGIAVLWVIAHNTNFYPSEHGVLWAFAALSQTGWIGVQLFFALSGFLITGNLLDSRGANNYYRAFYVRRVLRIFPLYYGSLVALLLLLPALVNLPPKILDSYDHQTGLWFFFSNYLHSSASVYWFPHFWSLAVEEQFYVVWPFVIALAPHRRLLLVFSGIAILSLVARLSMHAYGITPGIIYSATVSRLDALALGAFGAYAFRDPAMSAWIRRHAGLLMASALTVLVIGALATHLYDIDDIHTIGFGYSLLAVGAGTVVVISAFDHVSSRIVTALRGALEWQALRSVGIYSYAMYVFHVPLSRALSELLIGPLQQTGRVYPVVYSAIIIVLSYILAWASYHAFETHFLKLKRYFVAGRMPAATTAT